MQKAKTLERLVNRESKKKIRRQIPIIAQELLDSGLFKKIFHGSETLIFVLNDTVFKVHVPAFKSATYPIQWSGPNGYTTLYDILEEVPDDVADKLVFYINVLPR